MTVIHTTELHGGNPFQYLVALLQHSEEVADDPERWMPWNYLETLDSLDSNVGTPLPPIREGSP